MMLKVAGILMFIGAFLGITILRAVYGFIPGLLGWLPWLWAGFVVGGGLSTLKRRNWGLCLTSSILLFLPYLILPFLMWADVSGEEINVPFALLITLLFLMIGILPVIGIILRKREWKIADLPGENDDDWVIGDILRKKKERENLTKGLAEKEEREE